MFRRFSSGACESEKAEGKAGQSARHCLCKTPGQEDPGTALGLHGDGDGLRLAPVKRERERVFARGVEQPLAEVRPGHLTVSPGGSAYHLASRRPLPTAEENTR